MVVFRRLGALTVVALAAIAVVCGDPTSVRSGAELPTPTNADDGQADSATTKPACPGPYSRAGLAESDFAFEGAATRWAADGAAEVTFSVRRWYRGGSAPSVTVRMPMGSGEFSSENQVKLLVSGDGSTAWGCGYTTKGSADTAEDWRAVFAPEEPPCPATAGSETDLSLEPPYSATYLTRWRNRDGCEVRLDVLMWREPGPDAHCGAMPPEIVMGVPLGTPSNGAYAIYVRDHAGGLRGPDSPPFNEHADLPEAARDTGYRQGPRQLWIVPDDGNSIYVVDGATVERWPQGRVPPCI